MLYAVSKGRIPNPVTWLVDSKIEAAQNLLKMKFPLIDGLQDPSVRGIHVTLRQVNWYKSLIQIPTGCALVLCPVQLELLEYMTASMDVPMIRRLTMPHRMHFHRGNAVTSINEKVQKQKGLNDFGLFAMAFATTVCYGNDPTTTRYVPTPG